MRTETSLGYRTFKSEDHVARITSVLALDVII